MAIWSRTKAELQEHIETTIRGVRGTADITATERRSITAAINEALIDLSIERGLDLPKSMLDDDTETTTSGTAYVDLDAGIVAVTAGTVVIQSENTVLDEMSLEAFFAYDPGEDTSSSTPQYYAIDTDGSGNIRMRLRPTPDATYTINFKCERLPDEDTVSALPGWYHGALRSLATSVALDMLGIPGGERHYRSYMERLKNIREQQRGSDSPIHIKSNRRGIKYVAPEERIAD